MRVTQSMLTNNMLRNLSSSYERLGKYQEQLNTQKKITKPSDDPVVAIKGMRYRTDLVEIEQYQRNLSEAYTWMESADDAMDKMTLALQRVRELTVQASTGTNGPDEKANIAVEVEQLKEHIATIANTKVGNKFIFNGTNTTEAPVNLGANQISSSTNDVLLEVSKGVQVNVNVKTSDLLKGSNTKDIFTELTYLINDLKSDGDIGKYLDTVDSHLSNVVANRANLGARYNRIELIDDRLGSQEVIANKIISENEDAEMEKVIINLTTAEAVHRAALGVGSKIMQPTLMDFLR
ncbi:flagellar hook-associated protein FlgL [Bacillus timonensis]|uniref:Flagellar hook-associated protein FlgL n=1 Tax=Bacillus timonensis TaxID=1033734 RepID=A0A4V3V7R4_9BACI|nr:flagellar hook-associated protein FlgL [Bacillus timonensis]THE12343.1 flagellar hook-associated protein FlgL [Bacillus timonensis]